jgi:hypothetical protein
MRSDSWFYEVFRQWPDLILRFLGDKEAEPSKEQGYSYGLRPAAPTRRRCSRKGSSGSMGYC